MCTKPIKLVRIISHRVASFVRVQEPTISDPSRTIFQLDGNHKSALVSLSKKKDPKKSASCHVANHLKNSRVIRLQRASLFSAPIDRDDSRT